MAVPPLAHPGTQELGRCPREPSDSHRCEIPAENAVEPDAVEVLEAQEEGEEDGRSEDGEEVRVFALRGAEGQGRSKGFQQ